MEEKGQCSERVSSDGWHYSQCKRKATVIRDNKPYCNQHDPEQIKQRKTKRQAKYKAESCPKCGCHPERWWGYCALCGTKLPKKGD